MDLYIHINANNSILFPTFINFTIVENSGIFQISYNLLQKNMTI